MTNFDEKIISLSQKGLAQYISDTDLCEQLVEFLSQETKISKIALRLIIKLLATLIEGTTTKGARWLTLVGSQKIKKFLEKIPLVNQFVDSLEKCMANFDDKIAANKEVNHILSGRRPAYHSTSMQSLNLELQVGVKELESIAELSFLVKEIRELISPQPPLSLRRIEYKRETRFFYGSQWLPFLGREQEINELKGFMQSEKTFSWWLLTGAPGAGKSRLALEICLRYGISWFAGFLPNTDTNWSEFNWFEWQPERPTLIIADYASKNPQDLRKIALSIYYRRDDLNFPVRLLLLERQTDEGDSVPTLPSFGLLPCERLQDDSWLRKFFGTGSDKYALQDSNYREKQELLPFSDQYLWQIIQTIITNSNSPLPGHENTIIKLEKIDPKKRPLYAMFLADTFVEGSAINEWNSLSLVHDVLEREIDKYWHPAGVTQQDKNLLALATMIRGINVSNSRSFVNCLIL